VKGFLMLLSKQETSYRSIIRLKEMHPNGYHFTTNITEIKMKFLSSFFQTKYGHWPVSLIAYIITVLEKVELKQIQPLGTSNYHGW